VSETVSIDDRLQIGSLPFSGESAKDCQKTHEWLQHHNLDIDSTAAYDRRFREEGFRFSYWKNPTRSYLEISIQVPSGYDMDNRGPAEEGTMLRYLVDKINNAVLILGGRSVRVVADRQTVRALKASYRPASRILECYGGSYDLEFRTESNPQNRGDVGDPAIAHRAGDSVSALENGTAKSGTAILGIDVGASQIKSVLQIEGRVSRREFYFFPLVDVRSTTQLIDRLATIVEDMTDGNPSRVDHIGISWASPVVEERIATRVKIEHFTQNPQDFEPIINLAETLSKRLDLPVHILNDGKAGALTVSRLTNTTDVLCLGLGTTIASGYVDGDGRVGPDIMEITACTFNQRAGADPRVSRYLSTKFGVVMILERLAVDFGDMPFHQKADALRRSYENGEGWAAVVYRILGVYLAELIALVYDLLRMQNVALFGGLSKNNALVDSAKRWLGCRYPDCHVKFTDLSEDLAYINAMGAAFFAMQKHLDHDRAQGG
jgi:predicted NBD/HSP70 family sugar kinase